MTDVVCLADTPVVPVRGIGLSSAGCRSRNRVATGGAVGLFGAPREGSTTVKATFISRMQGYAPHAQIADQLPDDGGGSTGRCCSRTPGRRGEAVERFENNILLVWESHLALVTVSERYSVSAAGTALSATALGSTADLHPYVAVFRRCI